MSSRLLIGVLALSFGAAIGCGPITEEEAPAPPAPTCAADPTAAPHAVDPFKELLVVDEAVMNSSAAANATSGPLSFRHAIEQIAGTPEDASATTHAWLDRWAPAPLRCAWLRARVENACDATCGACSERRLDLARAPFRLIAIANRIDLSEPSDPGAGEGRLLFAATDGPGDDPRSPSLPVSIIFEFRLVGEREQWAARWHALGVHHDFDEAYVRALSALTGRFARRDLLAQIRVNDAASGERAVMLEFHLDAHGVPEQRLTAAGLRRTPTHAMDGSAQLQAFVELHATEILSDRFELPAELLANRVELGETWHLPSIDEPLRRAFAASTCDGCHGAEHPTTDGGFHVSPRGRGAEKLSRFLFDPEHREEDELTRRTRALARWACAP